MSKPQHQHAKRVVSAFQGMLSQHQNELIGPEHFTELELLIESAISTAMLEELEQIACRADSFAAEIHRSAQEFSS